MMDKLFEIIKHKTIMIFVIISLTGIAGLFASPSFLVIENRQIFTERKRPVVQFDHRKHEKAGLKCADCHHGANGPAAKQKETVLNVRSCAACHGKSNTDLMRSYHKMCIDCHDKMNKGAVFCGSCHKK